jgi:hypothetical protein
MDIKDLEELSLSAQRVLKKNWKEGFTIPTSKLYPFQWNWDSGFTSIGHSHFNLDYAIRELQSLLSGQWDNGIMG